MLMQVSLFIVTFSHILKIIVVTNLGFLKWLWYLNCMKYLGRNRRRYWCSAVQLRLWKHDHVRPGSLMFDILTNIWTVKIVKITFIVDHISPHTGYACLQPSRGLDALWSGSESLCRTIQCLTKAIKADSLYNEIEYGKIEEEEERRPRNFQVCPSL